MKNKHEYQEESGQTNISNKTENKISLSILIASILGALIAGYFLGREHLKYEIRSIVSDASSAFSKSVQETFYPESQKEPEKESFFTEQINSSSESFSDSGKNPILPNKELKKADTTPTLLPGETHQTDRSSISLVEARIDHVERNKSFGIGTIKTEEKYLLIKLNIENTHDRKILNFYKPGYLTGSTFSMVDDVDNEIRCQYFSSSSDVVGTLSSIDDILPGENRTHLEVFMIPPPKTQYLMLSIDLKSVAGEGKIKVKIPIEQVLGFSSENTE